jgi:hypothetical protein
MYKSKIFVKYLLVAHGLIAAVSLQAVDLLSSQGAWTNSGTANPAGIPQSNNNSGGSFNEWNGASFWSHSGSEYFNMQATDSNPQQNYTAGYTYSFQSQGHSAIVSHHNSFQIDLLAGGDVVSGGVSGNNYSLAGSAGSNIITGSIDVDNGDVYNGKQIGMRISSNGTQTRFLADGSTSMSALLTNHAGFNGGNGVGALYSTSFSDNAQTINYDHVLDMELTLAGGAIENHYLRLNNNTTEKNIASFGSDTDTFRSGTKYRVTFNAEKAVNGDATQNSLDIIMGGGGYTQIVTLGGAYEAVDFTIDADARGLVGSDFIFGIEASDVTTTGINQYRISDFNIQVIPESDSFAFWAASLTLTWIMTRRRFKATKAQV